MSTDQKSTVNPSASKQDSAQEQTATSVTTTTTITATKVIASATPVNSTVVVQEGEKVEEDSHKVFVGNLSFQTKEEGLVEFFETSGKVLEAKIITIRSHQKRRSAGYGFVTFATLEDTLKAAKDLDKKELDGREINVEVARPKPIVTKVVTSSESEGESAPKQRKRRARKNKDKKSTQDTSETTQDNDTTKEITRETTKATKNGKKDKDTSGGEETQTSQSDNASVTSDASSSRRPRRKNKSKAKNPEVAAAIAERRRIKKELTEPSQTTLFVANIPYSSTDETLLQVFKDYKVASAHVARMRNGRSKGYGFVDLESHDEQVKALENIKDVELEDRTIYLKVALSERPKETAVNGEEKSTEPVVKKDEATAPVKKEEPVTKKEDAAPVKKEEPVTKKEDVAPVKKEEPVTKKEDAAPAKKEEPVTKKEVAPVKKEEITTKKEAAPVKKEEPAIKKE